MSLRKISPVLFGTALLLGAAPLSAAGPSASMLADTCAGCHGVDGSSVGPASPSIAGMSEAYFIESMEGFKSGERPSTIMQRIAKGYTEEEIELMGGFFADKPFVRYPQQTDAAKVAKGEALYEKNCETCHDENGSLADDDSGILAGQWLPYMTYAMQDFTSGTREMPKKMKKKVDKLDEAQLEALLQFFASQQ
jgi:sulfide dehydrogenase cytochrome subunit